MATATIDRPRSQRSRRFAASAIAATISAPALAAALVVSTAPAASAAPTVDTEPDTTAVYATGAGQVITLSNDHFAPGETIEFTGTGFVVNPSTNSNPGQGVVGVKLNSAQDASSYEEFPWATGGPDKIADPCVGTSGPSCTEGFAAFAVSPSTNSFSGTITIPADLDIDSAPAWNLTFLAGSLSTQSGGKLLSTATITVNLPILEANEGYAKITSIAHTPGSNNNKTISLDLRNFTTADGIAQKLAFKIDSSSIVVDGASTLECVTVATDGDADVTIALPSAFGSLTAGAHTLNVLWGTACNEVLSGTPGFPYGGTPGGMKALSFKVTTAEVTSTQTHYPGGSFDVDLKGFTQASGFGGQKIALILQNAKASGATWTSGMIGCIETGVTGNATGTVEIPGDAPLGDLYLVALAGSNCGAGGSDTPIRSIPIPVTLTAMPFAATADPSISGTASVGSELTMSAPTFSYTPDATTTQWLRNGAAISGATDTSYTVVAADAGKKISVKVTAEYDSQTVETTSAETDTVAKGTLAFSKKPAVSGTYKVGKKLKATVKVAGSGVTVKYQWLRNGKAIKKATKPTYKLVKADGGKKISVKVTATKSGYNTLTSTTKAKKVKK